MTEHGSVEPEAPRSDAPESLPGRAETPAEVTPPSDAQAMPPAAEAPAAVSPPRTDADDFVERAIESVLDQVPDVADAEPEGSAKLQPWAETAAPPSKNKRPLSELLEQYAERVAAAPDAVAGRPRGQHPVAAFFARFAPQGGRDAEQGRGGGRRRRGRRGTPVPAGSPGRQPQPAPEQRQRRPWGGGGQPGAPKPPRPPAEAGAPPPEGGEGRRRRRSTRGRGRRRRGGGGGGGGAPAPG